MMFQMPEKVFVEPSYKMGKGESMNLPIPNTKFLYTANNVYINLQSTEYNQHWSVPQRAAKLFTVLVQSVKVPEMDSTIYFA